MDEYKILFAGPTGAGKTTAIHTVSDISVVSTEVVRSSLDVETVNSQLVPKKTVTIGIDYGELNVSDTMRIRLYGVPGQIRFEFLWDLIHKGSAGTIILFDISSKEYLSEIKFFITRFAELLLAGDCVIGLSKFSEAYSHRIAELTTLLEEMRMDVPVMPVDIRDKEDVLKLLYRLIK
nr:ATP/GTP-binding protein [uncultured Enterobacter sp.]